MDTDTSPRRAVITGIGVVNPLGNDRESFWTALVNGKSAISDIGRFDPAGLPIHLSAEVSNFTAADHAPRRLVVKSDRFSHFAMVAAAEALADAAVDPAAEDPFRFGISFGNNSGGWDICERGFDEYYKQGPAMINPWQATAWFPTAPQGFVSICYGLRGYSKSYACDRASGGSALLFGLRSIRWGHNDLVLVGGAEAPITRLGVAAHVSSGDLSRASHSEEGYLPFDRRRTGLVLGEGSTVLVLEERERALARGARIYGEVLAAEQRTGDPARPAATESAIAAAMNSAAAPAGEIDAVFADGAASPAADLAEGVAISNELGSDVRVTVPKSSFGHLYGAAAGTDLAVALLAMRDGVLPPTIGSGQLDEACRVRLTVDAEQRPVRSALISSRSREGTNVAIVVSAA